MEGVASQKHETPLCYRKGEGMSLAANGSRSSTVLQAPQALAGHSSTQGWSFLDAMSGMLPAHLAQYHAGLLSHSYVLSPWKGAF